MKGRTFAPAEQTAAGHGRHAGARACLSERLGIVRCPVEAMVAADVRSGQVRSDVTVEMGDIMMDAESRLHMETPSRNLNGRILSPPVGVGMNFV